MDNTNYYQRKREIMLNRAKKKKKLKEYQKQRY